ncbi:hypothetical protein MTR67_023477, partial [Solanum verrucosum]
GSYKFTKSTATKKKSETHIQKHQEQEVTEQEEQWQTQKRKPNKNQEQTIYKTAWRPVSPQHKDTRDNRQKEPTPAVAGGMDGGCKEKPTNLQEGVTKGGSLSHVLHEVFHIAHRTDLRDSTTTTPVQNNQHTSQGFEQVQKGSGVKEERRGDQSQTLGKKAIGNQNQNLQLDYDILNSEDEFDEDTQSLNEEEEDETSANLIKAFGSTFQRNLEKFMITFVYAKCNVELRKALWDRFIHLSTIKIPWCTMCDFNVITSIDEKKGGIPYNMNKSFEFISVIEASGLIDLGYSGSQFTWCNNRAEEARVWKRFDRAMVNDIWLEKMSQTVITRLPSVGSDHSPLLVEMIDKQEHTIKYFKFLNLWVDKESFINTVQNCWVREVTGDPMWCLHKKMKRLASTLSCWSKREYVDIFASVKDFEEKVKNAEIEVLQNNTANNRTKLQCVNAEYIKYLKMEADILKQKTQLQWFREGDANANYFHALMRGRKRKLFIHQISNENGEWIQGDVNIARAACEHFQNIFTGHHNNINEEFIQCIPRMVTEEQNQKLKADPTIEEVKQVVFAMNPNSAAGPDGMNGNFFQEIIHGIKKPKEGDNVVIKLDMAKAYDRVFWAYTCLVMRKMGFSEFFIDMIWTIMSNNWYSVIINGAKHGFFHSTRGLKQGDFLSPALFILGAEVLSRMLNNLYLNKNYQGFHMEPKGPQISHLSFADDVIIFTSGQRTSNQLIMKTLTTYEQVSDQLINRDKSHSMLPVDSPQGIAEMIKEEAGFRQKDNPINYLGCPLYIGGQRIIYYSHLVDKIAKRISGWQAKMLNFGGRLTLVKHVLHFIPIHTMAAISPPKTTLHYIKRLTADFFWEEKKIRKSTTGLPGKISLFLMMKGV